MNRTNENTHKQMKISIQPEKEKFLPREKIKLNITVDFTPWFYIAVIAFLAAAFFCYKRMSASKT